MRDELDLEHVGLQPLVLRVAAAGTSGCSLWYLGLQPLVLRVATPRTYLRRDELDRLSIEHFQRFTLTYTLTKPPADWAGSWGRGDAALNPSPNPTQTQTLPLPLPLPLPPPLPLPLPLLYP